ncbi:MAG: antibiotic biosynthesis monooxygenase [Clostridiales bacterium]|nr:antibiotic biosynthesis monooxygenase [Clostridiales bacterium]
MIRVVATFTLKPGHVQEAVEMVRELVELTRREAGCAAYDLAQSTKDEDVLVVLEAWESQAHLDAHSASAHFTAIVPRLAALCAVPPVVDTFTQLI